MLCSDEVGSDEGKTVLVGRVALEHPNDTGMVNSCREDGEQVGQQERLLLEVEAEGLVVAEEK